MSLHLFLSSDQPSHHQSQKSLSSSSPRRRRLHGGGGVDEVGLDRRGVAEKAGLMRIVLRSFYPKQFEKNKGGKSSRNGTFGLNHIRSSAKFIFLLSNEEERGSFARL